MYLNCKYPYWRFKKTNTEGFPLLSFLTKDFIYEIDPVERLKERNEYLKAKLKHKRFGTPKPKPVFKLKYKPRFAA